MTKPVLSPRIVDSERPPLGRSFFAGVVIVALFTGAFASWAALAPLDSAAIATGVVGVDSNRKDVQHLEGGIIRKLLVREGDRVKQGQTLIVLSDTKARAKMAYLNAQIQSTKTQKRLIESEIADVKILLKKGLARKPKLLQLLRRQAQILGEQLKHQAELREVADQLSRSKIEAPVSGRVVALKVHTRGGVIQAGQTLMSIVPENELLVIEARVNPNDIDIVRAGLAASVRLSPYNSRTTPPLNAKVQMVSADRVVDEKSGIGYYVARIVLEKTESQLGAQGIILQPGMPAEVIIRTGRRTAFDYAAAPILRSFRRALRED